MIVLEGPCREVLPELGKSQNALFEEVPSMSYFEPQGQLARDAAQGQARNEPSREIALMLSQPRSSPQHLAGSSESPTKAPNTPHMIRPIIAWRRLCAQTGGGITLGSFYRWIRSGRVYTVRLGGRVFVPSATLEELINRCLSGEQL